MNEGDSSRLKKVLVTVFLSWHSCFQPVFFTAVTRGNVWGVPTAHRRPGLKTPEMKELECDPIRVRFLGYHSKNQMSCIISRYSRFEKMWNPIFSKILGSAGQPSLVGYPGPI